MRARNPLGRHSLTFGCECCPVAHECAERRLVEVLELATTASRKMTARRNGAVRSGLQAAIGQNSVARRGQRDVPAIRRDAIALRGDPDDLGA